MNQHQILKNRTLNSIEEIKFTLKSQDSMTIFNDLLILQHIIPHLEKQTLRGVLREIKSLQKSLSSPMCSESALEKILELLSHSSGDDSLLKDFLQCTGYSGPVEVPGS